MQRRPTRAQDDGAGVGMASKDCDHPTGPTRAPAADPEGLDIGGLEIVTPRP